MSGKKFCNCTNWKGTCIYQEFIWNGGKAKKERKSYECSVIDKQKIEDNYFSLALSVPHEIASSLIYPGSYVFIRNPGSVHYYDMPISVIESDDDNDIIKLIIEVKGIKTKDIFSLEKGQNAIIRAPYWNGILGLRNIYKAKKGTSLIIAKGIGQAPSVPVMKKLKSAGNKFAVIIDREPMDNIFIDRYLKNYDAEVYEMNIFENGKLSRCFKDKIGYILKNNDINVVYASGSDFLSSSILGFLNPSVPFSCCNNTKMCCGEGICGCCTVKEKSCKLRRMCKFQTDPKFILNS